MKSKFASDGKLKNPTPKPEVPTLIIDVEYRDFLPRRTRQQYKGLEEDILYFGCQQPIIVSEDNVILDGHYRYEICKKHNLPFKTETVESKHESDEILYAEWLDYENNFDELEM